jgi:hypothetical protein
MTVIARAALLLSALAGCAVVFIRYTLAHLGFAPMFIRLAECVWKEFGPQNRNLVHSRSFAGAELAFANHRQCEDFRCRPPKSMTMRAGS